jgi:hypothetical protein
MDRKKNGIELTRHRSCRTDVKDKIRRELKLGRLFMSQIIPGNKTAHTAQQLMAGVIHMPPAGRFT